jgi:hypothetical protein
MVGTAAEDALPISRPCLLRIATLIISPGRHIRVRACEATSPARDPDLVARHVLWDPDEREGILASFSESAIGTGRLGCSWPAP